MIETINISDIKVNPDNPRIIKDDKFKKLVQSIKDFPEMLDLRPIVVNDEMVVLGGNMRLKACKEAGMKKVPTIKASQLSAEQQREFIIKDNVGFGEWDWEMIANEWDPVQVMEWGLDIPDFKPTGATEDDYEIPDEIETDIVPGDLFEIGPHRLLCGDSTKEADVAKLMNKEKSEILFTSPPYSDMRDYNGSKDLSVNNLIDFIPSFFPYANYQVINLGLQRKDNEIVQYWDDYIQKAKVCGYKFLSWNIWSRLNNGTGSIGNATAMFPIVHEWIFVFGEKRKNINPTIENENAGKVSHKSNRQTNGTLKKRTHVYRSYSELRSVIECKTAEVESAKFKHPAMFPVELPAEYIKAMTKDGEIVAESFLGSGTTMVAAHQLNRKCYGIELDPKYCQITIDRMLKLDQSIDIKRNGEPYLKSSFNSDKTPK